MPARPDHVVSQLRIAGLYPSIDPPVFSQHGGEVSAGFPLSMTSDSGTIYFTTDGSDPREEWTSSAVGSTYTAPVNLNASSTVKARSLVAGEWSALAEASFLVGDLADSSNLVVSEIFYNPTGDSQDLEFIELQNISSDTIDLGGVQFTEGIEFTFLPNTLLNSGARLLLVRNLAAFTAEYGNGLPIAGEFQNTTVLSNSGEQILLLAANGVVIRDFTYSDDLPWPTAPDSAGHSLILIDPAANPDHSSPQSWRTSLEVGGNPSTTDSVPYQGGDLLEYALGNNTSPLGFTLDGQSLSVSYTHLVNADDVNLQLESSIDLITWNTLDSSFEISGISQVGAGQEEVTWTSATTPLTSEPRLFFRLAISE